VPNDRDQDRQAPGTFSRNVSGRRFFGQVDGQHLLADPHVAIQGDRVLHLRFRVRR